MYHFLRNVAAALKGGTITATFVSIWVSQQAQRAASASQPSLSMTKVCGKEPAGDLEPGLQAPLPNALHTLNAFTPSGPYKLLQGRIKELLGEKRFSGIIGPGKRSL